ncbi:MAG TPA: hypothetical protein VLC46_09825 [Thermoanaerobaculia bacterium]|jgi:imidazolonepropionase-like amidohydrolase|nr:hypothetical protein [Thermoanaerobaculia bacterium]
MRVLLILTLLLAAARSAADDAYALLGTVLTPDRVLTHGVVVVRNGVIESVLDTPPTGMRAIDTAGIILPGMIDLHNHVTWNFHTAVESANPLAGPVRLALPPQRCSSAAGSLRRCKGPEIQLPD